MLAAVVPAAAAVAAAEEEEEEEVEEEDVMDKGLARIFSIHCCTACPVVVVAVILWAKVW